MAELADALDLGSSGNPVQVRFLSSALCKVQSLLTGLFSIICVFCVFYTVYQQLFVDYRGDKWYHYCKYGQSRSDSVTQSYRTLNSL